MHHVNKKDIYIGTAAVSDYRPARKNETKLKKDDKGSPLILELVENQDILKSVSELDERPYVVGFAAETNDLIKNAKTKFKNKGLDLVVANDVSDKSIGFDSDDNAVTLITKRRNLAIEKESKRKIAKKIIKLIAEEIDD
tara:strand:- start:124 stop:543 length:420 start_codon:yes stop_codon:yes gene_type:complete